MPDDQEDFGYWETEQGQERLRKVAEMQSQEAASPSYGPLTREQEMEERESHLNSELEQLEEKIVTTLGPIWLHAHDKHWEKRNLIEKVLQLPMPGFIKNRMENRYAIDTYDEPYLYNMINSVAEFRGRIAQIHEDYWTMQEERNDHVETFARDEVIVDTGDLKNREDAQGYLLFSPTFSEGQFYRQCQKSILSRQRELRALYIDQPEFRELLLLRGITKN